ncbi:MAG: hypothetical protein ABI451_13095, partial [Dokdonella sp.]
MTALSATRTLAVNLASSYANIVLMALITLLVVPIYVHTLGVSQWGVVALCMTVQGVLFSIDVALGPLMLRDVALAASRGRQQDMYRRFLRIYGGFALGLFVLVQLAVFGWQQLPSQAETASSDQLVWALRIVLVQFLFQFSNNAAIGYWNGLERQRFANLRIAAFLLVKHGLALLLVIFWQATAIAYLLPFATVCAIEFLLNYRRVRLDDRQVATQADTERAAPVTMAAVAVPEWRGFAAFGIAAGLGVLTTLIDRAYLSLA